MLRRSSSKPRQEIMNLATTLSANPYDKPGASAGKPENARGLSALLLAAAVAALAVAADQLIETWADGHLFLAWVTLWAVVFVGSLMLTGTVRRMRARLLARLDQWAAARARARAQARLIVMAQRDARPTTAPDTPAVPAKQAQRMAEQVLANHSFHV